MAHYYSEQQTTPLQLKTLQVTLLGKTFNIVTGTGVFSKKKIDRGTEILIEHSVIKDNWDILDLGCGYGVISIALALKYNTHSTMVDINKRAVRLAAMNLKQNNINAELIQGNLYDTIPQDKQFNTILSNPPQHAGKEVCFEIIDKARLFLKKGGLLQLVARHNKGGKPLAEHMNAVFGNVKEVCKKSGYRVYVSEIN